MVHLVLASVELPQQRHSALSQVRNPTANRSRQMADKIQGDQMSSFMALMYGEAYCADGPKGSVGSPGPQTVISQFHHEIMRNGEAQITEKMNLIRLLRDETNSASVYARCVAIVGERQP